MRGKKELLAWILCRSRILDFLASQSTKQLIVFNYHRLSAHKKSETCFNDGVFGPTVSEFGRQMRWLKQHTDVISERDLLNIMSSRIPAPKRGALITFDDGYRDNFLFAYPVLRHENLPAIFFIATGITTTRTLGWWDLIPYLIKKTERPILESEGQRFQLPLERTIAIRFHIDKMKSGWAIPADDYVHRLSVACETPLPEPRYQDEQLMTWEQIREVSRGGISIGSHTHHHKVLANIDATSQLQEMKKSKEILENELGEGVNSIAYPVGGPEHFTEESMSIAAQCGYQLGFSFNTGINDVCSIAPFNVRRVGAPKQVEMLAAMSALPSIFCWK